MKKNNAPISVSYFEREISLLIKEKCELDQMREDAQEMQKFRRLIVHTNND